MARLRFEALSHRYAADWVLKDLDLDVADGEAHALLGPSGAGKSTLLNLLSGLLTPTRGRVLLDDVDVTAAPPRVRQIAQVFQFPVVYDGLTVRGNLEFPLRGRGLARPEIARRVAAVAELMEIGALLDTRGPALGAYDRQKVAMARALVRPDVAAVLLDEPLTAVEPTAKWRLRGALKSVQRELGTTMIYVTHDQLEALTFADRVSVIEGGRILQVAAPETIYAEPAHEFVGHFIGSPGMNLLDARIEDDAVLLADGLRRSIDATFAPGACRFGFRPEDGRAVTDASAEAGWPIDVEDVRALALRGGRATGLVSARLAGAPIQLRQDVEGLGPGPATLLLAPGRVRLFRDGARMRPIGGAVDA